MAPNALDGYELIDFGEGRKLEQWGDILLDRPSPAAEGTRRQEPRRWQDADGRYERFGGDSGSWSWRRKPPESWQVQWKELRFLLAPTPFGHVGLFPEQQGNWDWLSRQSTTAAPLKVLNLFAYSGASTLAVSAEQNEVVHVDASKSSVNKARQNASASGLENRTLRWIVEDVQRFCEREVRRGNQYDAFVIDPPAFGHGPKGERWDLEQHLAALIENCVQLWTGERGYVLLTGHTAEVPARALKDVLQHFESKHRQPLRIETGNMNLVTPTKRSLNSGHFARWTLQETASC